MTDAFHPRTGDDGELLSAYLADDLDGATAAALEDRLAREPELARQLDAMADLLVELRKIDEVAAPAGFEQRLRARLDREKRPTTGMVVPLRERRAWSTVGSAAAAFALLALVGIGAVGVLGNRQAETPTAEVAGEAQPTDVQAFSDREESAALGESPAAAEEQGPAAPEMAGSASPVIIDRQRVLERPRDIRVSAEAAQAARVLLGTPVENAAALSEEYRRNIAAHPPLVAGLDPGACLDEAVARFGGAAVPVAVQPVVYRRSDALSYAVVTASRDATTLDTVRTVVVDPATCEVLAAR